MASRQILLLLTIILLPNNQLRGETKRYCLGNWRNIDSITFNITLPKVLGWQKGLWRLEELESEQELLQAAVVAMTMAKLWRLSIQINGYSDGYDFENLPNDKFTHESLGACRALNFLQSVEKVYGYKFSDVSICGLYDEKHKDYRGTYRRIEVKLARQLSCAGEMEVSEEFCKFFDL